MEIKQVGLDLTISMQGDQLPHFAQDCSFQGHKTFNTETKNVPGKGLSALSPSFLSPLTLFISTNIAMTTVFH